MAGWWKTFDLGPLEHARRLFVESYADTWLPAWLLWASGTVIPVIELVAGTLMCLGLRVREAGIAFGFILIVVTYGHLLKEPLFDTTHHIFPRLVLLTFVLAAPAGRDLLSLDAWLGRRVARRGAPVEELQLHLKISQASPQTTWSREEIYGDDGR
jgi:uncharacterized membrane protein YphA (DoxX/SURF4 family)